MKRLFEIPNIVGVKDATGDLSRPAKERILIGKDWNMLSGEDGTALGYNAQGGHGCISVTANVAPGHCATFQRACREGDYRAALELHDALMPLHLALFMEPSPAGVKFAVSELGHCSADARLPVVPVTAPTAERITAVMQDLGLLG